MATKNKETLERIYEAINSGNLDELDKYIDADCVEKLPDPMVKDVKNGPEGAKELISFYKKAFPDLKFTAQHFVEEGDILVSHYQVTGTHTGEMMGIPPTNKQVKVDGFDMIKFRNGKATEHWGLVDNASMMQQLGLGPQQ